jgi:drug/metabolite transporter (DMT)-like permease
MQEHRKAYVYAAATILFWSTVASAFKISLRHLDFVPLLFYASVISTAVLFVFLCMFKKLGLLKSLTKTDVLHSAVLGFLNPFLYYIVLFKAYSLLYAQEALVLNFTWPITLVVLSIPILKQKITLRSIIAILVSFAGVLVIATKGNIWAFKPADPLGVLLAVGSSVVWALYWIYNVKDKTDEVVKLFLNFLFGCGFIFLVMLFSAKLQIPTFKGVLGSAYIGLFEMGITFLVWLRALKLSETTAGVSNLIYMVPFLSVIVIHFAVGEPIFFSTVAGLILIVAGIILQKL